MPTNNFATDIVVGNEIGSQFSYLNKSNILVLNFITNASTNLITYYRMMGYDTTSNSMKVWIVQDTPDPTAARHPTPAAVTISNGFIVDRWQA
jgi:hypothetical protein